MTMLQHKLTMLCTVIALLTTMLLYNDSAADDTQYLPLVDIHKNFAISHHRVHVSYRKHLAETEL